MGVAARIGTAMHKTMQSLTEQPIHADNIEAIAAETGQRFNTELGVQRAHAFERPREFRLQWDSVRINRALEAVIAEAIRTQGSTEIPRIIDFQSKPTIGNKGLAISSRQYAQKPLYLPACEVPVQSKNQLFRGRIDRVEQIPEGIRLIDYKSAYRDDLPERYTRQIQLYAFLWYETTDDWPVEGQVFYPLKGTFYHIPIKEYECRKVVNDAEVLIKEIANNSNLNNMAKPGYTCKVCEYRPWCRPFWEWQSTEKILVKAKEKASIGFEGEIVDISLIDHYWRLVIGWRGIKIRMVVPQERFPHLSNASVRQVLRVLDAPLKGALNQPAVHVFDSTEIFLISQTGI